MATIKSFTSLQQSKKLAEILPLESADMFYVAGKGEPVFIGNKMVAYGEDDYDCLGGPDVLCWSLAALLGVLPEKYTELIKEGGMYRIIIKDSYMTCLFENPVDACCEMIIRLNELKCCDYGLQRKV